MSEYDANQQLVDSKEQVILDAHKARRSAKVLSDQLRKERLKDRFWVRLQWMTVTAVIILIASNVYQIIGKAV